MNSKILKAFCFISIFCFGCNPSIKSDLSKPNIVIIICDQLNPDALGCYGGPVPTPNIDKLASDGLLFENAVCPLPVCSPSRASLVLGTYPHEHGIAHNCMLYDYPAVADKSPDTEEGITNEDITLDRILHENGYNTYQFGKWHLTGEKLAYYEFNFGEHHEYAEEMTPVFNQVKQLPRERWMNWYDWILPVKRTERYEEAVKQTSPSFQERQYAEFITKIGELDIPVEQNFDYRVAEESIKAIHDAGDGPFILTCSFNYPHDPNVVPEPYYNMFNPEDIKLPDNHNNLDPYFEKAWSHKMVEELGEVGVREFLRCYYASVRLIDDQVGRVLDALKDKDRMDNTIIIFLADHGDMMGGHNMVWKSNHSFYDEVVRIPCIFSYPAKINHGKADFPINIADIPATLLSLIGHEVASTMTGNDLTPFLIGDLASEDAPQYVLCERLSTHPEHRRTVEPGRKGNFMIRGNGWKYVLYSDKKEFLYDLGNDPEELTNLADCAEYKTKKQEMNEELQRLLIKTNYKF